MIVPKMPPDGQDLVADLEGRQERLLRLLPVALWTDQQEVEADDHEQGKRKPDERASLPVGLCEGLDEHRDSFGDDEAAYRLPLTSPQVRAWFYASGRTPSAVTPRCR